VNEKPWQVYIVSGTGDRFDVEAVADLKAARRAVYALDMRFEEWESNGFPELPENDPLAHYEGCNVYAKHEHGEVFWFSENDVWLPEDAL
jgi:hypothetical protein